MIDQLKNRDFKNQDLRGRSFKGRDLTDADFSDALLGSADFRGATLVRTKFCNAKFGYSPTMQYLKNFWGTVIGILVAGLIWPTVAMFSFVTGISKGQLYAQKYFSISDQVIMTFLTFSIAWLISRRNRYAYSLCIFLALIATVVFKDGSAALGSIILGILFVYIALGIAAIAATTGKATTISAIIAIIVMTIAPVILGNKLIAEEEKESIFFWFRLVISAIFFLIYGNYLARQALFYEKPRLSFLRSCYLSFATICATRFEGSIQQADFSDAHLDFINFGKAKMLGCTWYGAKNMHLAQTRSTLLALHKVRNLLTSGQSDERDFSHLNLTGANFSGMNLSGFDFSHSNLSYADFSGCDLRGANFSSITTASTKFNAADLNGTILEKWHIAPQTKLEEAIIPDGSSDLNLNNKNYSMEHSQTDTLSQNTISLELVKAETAMTHLKDQRDSLNSLLKDLVNRPMHVNQTLESHMTDNRRTIGNVHNNNGVISQGDHAINTNTVTLAAQEQVDIKALFEKLDQILAASALPKPDAEYVRNQVAIMSAAVEQNATPDVGKIERGLNVVKSIVSGVDGLAQTAVQVSEVAAKIGGYLGF